MKKQLKPEIQQLFNKISVGHILIDITVRNEFFKRKLDIKNHELSIVCTKSGKYHVHGFLSTESHSAEIAIMKYLIKEDIVNNESNYL